VHSVEVSPAAVLHDMKEMLAERFEITHVTIQCELEPCDQANVEFHFGDGREEHSHERGNAHDHASAQATHE